MKTAIYIEQGVTQLVLTPENEWEKSIIRNIRQGENKVAIRRGSFYHCQGGWARQGNDDESLILVTGINPSESALS